MKNTLLLLLISLLFSTLQAQEIQPRNLLSGDFSIQDVSSLLVKDWEHFPKDKAAWQNLPKEIQSEIMERGDAALEYNWPALPATLYLEYTRNGNRSNFQAVYFERRSKLGSLVMAEMLTRSGKYLDQIINGVWAISEESTWCVPAHISLQEDGHTPLPKPDEDVIDLFAAETGTTMAWIYYFLKDQLDEITPVISQRIEMEMEKRIFSPYLEREDFWWMGLGERKNVNNWNPWVISNWLTSVLIMEKDPERKAESIHKAMYCLDNFINIYPDDGGCDEGPGYWGHAGGSLFDCLDLLYSASDGKINIYNQPLIQNIGTYITKAYIKQPYYLNFADASAKTKPNPDIVYRFGKAINSPEMMSFAGFLLKENGDSYRETRWLSRQLNALFSYADLQEAATAEPLPRDIWLPDLEVFAARAINGSSDGFYIAGKGGHNAESHNHNDVGNYVVYYNGLPVLIDVGVEEYRRETFSSQRYSIWTMQSQYHTLPTINGQMQSPGRNFKGKNIKYKADEKGIQFSLDIADAYPEEAGVEKWERTIEFERGSSIKVEEAYKLKEVKGETALYFVTACRPTISRDGSIVLRDKNREFTLFFLFPPKLFEASIESIRIDDRRLLPVWGEEVFRLKLQVTDTKKKGKLRYTLESLE